MEQKFEKVYTVTDFYDGPRGGIANFRGHPHVYESLWNIPAPTGRLKAAQGIALG
jgi:hypothetical protein